MAVLIRWQRWSHAHVCIPAAFTCSKLALCYAIPEGLVCCVNN
jgi:hypothetical protein